METIKNQSFRVTIITAVVSIIAIVGFCIRYNDRITNLEAGKRHLDAKTELYAVRYDAQVVKLNATDMEVLRLKTSIEEQLKAINQGLKDLKNGR